MIRLLAVDIDGTMTYRDRRLDLAAVEAIRRAEDAGISVVIATGNIFRFAEAASVLIGTSGPLIAEDGGIVFDFCTERMHVLGDRADADRALAEIKSVFENIETTRSNPDRLTGVVIRKTVSIEEVRRVIREKNLPVIAVDSGWAIHLRRPEVNKGNALKKVSSITKVPLTEIAAIGDGYNDVEMLQVAGLSFAVANSVEEAKRASQRVTPSPHGRGVAEAVEEVLKHAALD
ncbi:MAG: phosphoglycolate phosphatase [Candidatus Hadarchaeaceae archaeon]